MQNLLNQFKALTNEEKLAFMKEAMPYMAEIFAKRPTEDDGRNDAVLHEHDEIKGHGHGQDACHDEGHDGMMLSAPWCKRRIDSKRQRLSRLHGPIGLDLGGREPAQIALAILAEIEMGRRAGRGEGQGQKNCREKDAGVRRINSDH